MPFDAESIAAEFAEQVDADNPHRRKHHKTAFGELPGRVYIGPGRTRRYTPAFVLDDSKLRIVLLTAALRYAHAHHEMPPAELEFDFVQRLSREWDIHHEILADGKDSPHWRRMAEHIAVVRSTGGYLALLGAVAYRAWRLHWHCRTIGDELNLSPSSVQTALFRLVRIAREIGFETYDPHRRLYSGPHAGFVLGMWESRWSVPEIARELCCNEDQIRHILRKAGVFQRHRKATAATPERIVELYAQGLGVTAVATQLHCHTETVTAVLERAGLRPRRRGNYWRGPRNTQQGIECLSPTKSPQGNCAGASAS